MHIPTFKGTTEILSRAQDLRLSLGERAALYLHPAACAGCRNFQRQVTFIRDAMKRYLDRDGG